LVLEPLPSTFESIGGVRASASPAARKSGYQLDVKATPTVPAVDVGATAQFVGPG
jgi:hypothetical protein